MTISLGRRAATAILVLSATPSFAATLKVGPNQTYAKPCQAIAAARPGDVIEVDAAGNYNGDTCAWSTDNLTIRGVNGRAKIDLTGVTPAQQKGIFTIYAPSATVESFELSGAAISQAAGNNGAGIRHQGLNLIVRDCYFHDNQDGILGAPSMAGMGTVLIERSEFAHNGAGDGYSHNMYLGNYASFTLQYSYTHKGNVGHLVKSRAHANYILYDRITDEAGGTASYEVDLPNGGTSILLGNLIEQSATTQNPALVDYAAEGVPMGYDTQLFVVNNTFVNDKKSGTFVQNKATTPALLENNIFYEGGTITSQANAMQISNFDSGQGDPKFVDVAQLDVHLAMGSPCIDKGTTPAMGGGQSLIPVFEYVHPLDATPRSIVGTGIDIGAHEYGNTGMSAVDAGAASDLATPAGSDAAMSNPLDMAGGGSPDAGGAAAGASSTGGCAIGLPARGAGSGGLIACVLLSIALGRARRSRRRA